jgi:hypothetical protein
VPLSRHFLRLVAASRRYLTDDNGKNVIWVRNPTAQQVATARLYASQLAEFLIDTWDGPTTVAGAAAQDRSGNILP